MGSRAGFPVRMSLNDVNENELLDYEDDEVDVDAASLDLLDPKDGMKGSYVSIHSSGFRDFLLKPELLRAIVDCGFEHPSEGENCPKMLLYVKRKEKRCSLIQGVVLLKFT